MSNPVPVSSSTLGNKRWKRPVNFLFAKEQTFCPLDVKELPKAVTCLPVCFARVEDSYHLAVLQGLQNQQNLFVGDNGKWLARYTPAEYRFYPFLLANKKAGQSVLCINESSGLIVEEPDKGELFFSDDGTPAPLVERIMRALSETRQNRERSTTLCQQLEEHGLIKPWPLKFKDGDVDRVLDGVFCIDESALNALSGDALVALRNSGALVVAYCQLLAMQHADVLNRLLHARKQHSSKLAMAELNLDQTDDHGNISFDNL